MKKINKMEKIDIVDRAKSVNSVNEYNSSDLQSNSIVNSKTLDYSVPDKNIKVNAGNTENEKVERRNYSTLLEGKTESYMGIPETSIEYNEFEKK